MDNLFEKDAQKYLSLEGTKNVFIADNEAEAKKAAVIAFNLGYENITVLEGGLNKFKEDIFNFSRSAEITSRNELATVRFREKAKKIIPELIEQNKNKAVPKKESKRVIGGC